MRRVRSVGTVAAAAVVLVAMAAPGFAATGIKGDPQPELKFFSVGTGISNGTVAIKPNGGIITAYDAPYKDQGDLKVCQLARGASKCKTTTTLMTLDSDDAKDVPQIFAFSNDDIDVLQEACCDSDTSGGDLLFESTDGGNTFSTPIRVGDSSVGTAVELDGDLVWASGQDSSGANINVTSVFAPAPPATVPQVGPDEDGDIYLSNDNGNLIVADTDIESSDITYVYEALKGSDFTQASSYNLIGKFSGDSVLGLSGDALVTLVDASSDYKVQLRVLSGSSFGSPVTVPDYANHGPEGWYVDQDPSGRITLLSILAAHGYDMYATRTTNAGKTFSAPENLGNATPVTTGSFTLDSIGSGMFVSNDGGDSSTDRAYPILAQAGVTVKLSASRVKIGKQVTVSGSVHPATVGDTVYVQKEEKGKWYDLGNGVQKAGGKFSFGLTEQNPASLTLRVESKDRTGYVEYGYSGAHTATWYKPKPKH